MRIVMAITGALFAAAGGMTAAGCKNGNYDGSFDGGFDAGTAIDGGTSTRVVQPDKTETVTSFDLVMDVTFGPGTFAQPATITITSAGEQSLDTGLVVPIYVVSADKEPAKFFQVTFHGSGNVGGGGGQSDRALVPALSTAGTFTAMAIAGVPLNQAGPTQTYWGLTKTFGTYSLAWITGAQSGAFADNAASCTAQCCHTNNTQPQVAGHADGCFCSSGPDLACFLAHCSDLAAAGARCSAIGLTNTANVDCVPFGSTNCPGPGCMGSFSGMCGTGGGGIGGSTVQACCINKNGPNGSCTTSTCTGFSAHCGPNTACPGDTKCCVFETESYCAADCPAAQRSCKSSADCADAGPDGGTCSGGFCPVAVCGTPPSLCK